MLIFYIIICIIICLIFHGKQISESYKQISESYKKVLVNFEEIEKSKIDAGYISELTPLNAPDKLSFKIVDLDIKKKNIRLEDGIITLKYRGSIIYSAKVMLFCEGILLKYNGHYYFRKFTASDLSSIVINPILERTGSPFNVGFGSSREVLDTIISHNYYWEASSHTHYYTDAKYYTKSGSIDKRYKNYPVHTTVSYDYYYTRALGCDYRISCLSISCSASIMENITKQICDKTGGHIPALPLDIEIPGKKLLLGTVRREQIKRVLNKLTDSQVKKLVGNLARSKTYSDSEWSAILEGLNIQICHNEG